MKPNIDKAEHILRSLEVKQEVPIQYPYKKIYIKATAKNINLLKDFIKNDWSWAMLIRRLDKSVS